MTARRGRGGPGGGAGGGPGPVLFGRAPDLSEAGEVASANTVTVLEAVHKYNLNWLTGEWATSGLRFSDPFPLN